MELREVVVARGGEVSSKVCRMLSEIPRKKMILSNDIFQILSYLDLCLNNVLPSCIKYVLIGNKCIILKKHDYNPKHNWQDSKEFLSVMSTFPENSVSQRKQHFKKYNYTLTLQK